MKIYYENSRNEILDFTSPPYVIRDIRELLDYNWNYINNKFNIYGYKRGIREIPISVNIFANAKEYPDVSNRFFEVIEYDILQNKRGKFWYDGQYVLCNLVSSKKTDWCMGVNFHISNVRIVTDYPFWISESMHSLEKSEVESKDNKRYLGRYKYRYASGQKERDIINDHFVECPFLLRFYGPCVNPSVTIDGVEHSVNAILSEGEYIEVDSRAETVVKVLPDGKKENLFHYRNNDIFKKIGTGKVSVVWNNQFNIDVILYKERSEPRWI